MGVVIEIGVKYLKGPPLTLLEAGGLIYVIHIYQSPSFKWAPGVFCTYFYNHARRLRLEKLLHLLELSRSLEVPTGF
jgi:hypothetical protein